MHPIYDKLYETVFVVCYEAGSAEVLSSLVKNKNFYKNILICTDGPSKRIFEKKLGFFQNITLNKISDLDENDLVLTGRSLVPELERKAVFLAKKNNIKTISYIDHWVNFENFYYPLKYKKNEMNNTELISQYIPDFIIVGDKYAFDIAFKYFNEKVYLIENEYFNDLRKESKQIKRTSSMQKRLLFISDPISLDNKQLYNNIKIYGFDEYDIIQDIVNNFKIFTDNGFKELVIRPHPNHNVKEFKDIITTISSNNDINILIDSTTSLLEQVVTSDVILGIESMALVVALELNKKAISYIPKNEHNKLSLLPHAEIIKIDKIEKIREYM